MTLKQWFSKKKNQKIVFFAVVIILVYFWIKNRKPETVGYSDLKGGYGSGGAGANPGTPGTIGGGNYLGDVIVTDTITPKPYYQGWEEHAEIRATGSPGDWRLTDHGTEQLQNGDVFRYIINGHIFEQNTRLSNYVYQSNDPASIWVATIKTANQNRTLDFWGTQEWQDPNLSNGFSRNTSVAFTYLIFNKAQL